MKVKDVRKALRSFSDEHDVKMEIIHTSGLVCSIVDVQEIQYKHGDCYIKGENDE